MRSIAVSFSDAVKFAGGDVAAAFQLRRVTHGVTVDDSASVSTDCDGQTVVTLTFSGPGTDPECALNGEGIPSLADRPDHMSTVFSADVSDAGGPLAGGGPAGNYH